MIRNLVRRGIKTSVHAEKQDPAAAWAAQILSQRFLKAHTLEEALGYMDDKPVGYYMFTIHDYRDKDRFVMLMRDDDETLLYNIRPNEGYSKYIVSMPEGADKWYDSISDFLDQLDDGRVDYEMIRNMEKDEMSAGAQWHADLDTYKDEQVQTKKHSSVDDVYPLLEHVKLSDCPKRPSIHRSRKVRYYRRSAPGVDNDICNMGYTSEEAEARNTASVEDVYSSTLYDRTQHPSIHRSRKVRYYQNADTLRVNRMDEEPHSLSYEFDQGENTQAADECCEEAYYKEDAKDVNNTKVDFAAIGRIRR